MFQNVCLLLLLEEHGRYLYYVERVQRPCPADTSFTTPYRIWGYFGFNRFDRDAFTSRRRDLAHACCHAAARSSARMSTPAFRKRAAMSCSVRRDASYSTLIVWAFSSNQVFRTPYTCRRRSNACNSRSPGGNP